MHPGDIINEYLSNLSIEEQQDILYATSFFEYIEYRENMVLMSSIGLVLSIATFIIMTIILVLNKFKKKQSKKILKIIWTISFVILIIMAILLIKFTNMPV